MSIHLCSFATGRFTGERLTQEATSLHLFDSITVLRDVLPEWKFTHPFPLNTRGYGYWFWKPLVILKTIEDHHCTENDIVVWIDAGCVLQPSTEWSEWIAKLREDETTLDMIVFKVNDNWTDRQFCKNRVISLIQPHPDDLNTAQIISGAMLMRVTERTKNLLEEWKTLCNDHDLVNDVPGDQRRLEHPDFIEHRHDQSLLSALIKKSNRNGTLNAYVSYDATYPARKHGTQAIYAGRQSG
jgi:hypothetical protein